MMLVQRKIQLSEFTEKVDITLANLSILKTKKAKTMRFPTLDAICETRNCQPGNILESTAEEK